jgi:2'-5' RNA ligase
VHLWQTFREPKNRPTFFLATRTNDPLVVRGITELQTALGKCHDDIKRCSIKPTKFHITLFVMYITTQEQLEKCFTILKNSADLILEYKSAIANGSTDEVIPTLGMQGVGQFGNHRVVWVAPCEDARKSAFCKLVERLYQRFLEQAPELVRARNVREAHAGADDKDDEEETDDEDLREPIIAPTHAATQRDQQFFFTPHMTILKSRSRRERTAVRKHITEEVYKEFANRVFGSQVVESIELLEMFGSRDGFYECYSKLVVVPPYGTLDATNSAPHYQLLQKSCPRFQRYAKVQPKATRP